MVLQHTLNVPVDILGQDMLASAFVVEGHNSPVDCLMIHAGKIAQLTRSPCPIRIHSGCLMGDVFDVPDCDCAWQLRHALRVITHAGSGAIMYLPGDEGQANGLVAKLASMPIVRKGISPAEAYLELGLAGDQRSYDAPAGVLTFLGVRAVRLITNNPAKITALVHYGVDVVQRIPSVQPAPTPQLRAYLQSKMREGHLIELTQH